jgi:hypothetical protein
VSGFAVHGFPITMRCLSYEICFVRRGRGMSWRQSPGRPVCDARRVSAMPGAAAVPEAMRGALSFRTIRSKPSGLVGDRTDADALRADDVNARFDSLSRARRGTAIEVRDRYEGFDFVPIEFATGRGDPSPAFAVAQRLNATRNGREDARPRTWVRNRIFREDGHGGTGIPTCGSAVSSPRPESQ